jgi:3-methyladenine DNA glycosylase AlkD
MTAKEVIAELKAMGSDTTKRIFEKHGAPPNQFGVKVEDMKKIQKKVKKNYGLSLELFDSGIPEAQYLAGLIADESKMTKKDLQQWADNASWHMVSEYTVPWIAAESKFGWELGLKWIDSGKENIQSTGWNTLASLVSIKQDEELDVKKIKELIKRIEKEIHTAGNRVRYTMNAFLIAAGGYISALTQEAQKVGKNLGKIEVNMGGTACKVPYAPDYIQKMVDKGVKRKKMARC